LYNSLPNDEDEIYVNDSSVLDIDDDYFDPYADSEDRDFSALMELSESHQESEWDQPTDFF
jgi:hypothetical protein